MSNCTRVGVSLSPELLDSLDSFCELVGYSRAAVLQSLLVNLMPSLAVHATRNGWHPLPTSDGRYRGASGRVLDTLIVDALGELDYRELQYDLLSGEPHE